MTPEFLKHHTVVHRSLPFVLAARLATVLGREQSMLRTIFRYMLLDESGRGFRGHQSSEHDVFVVTFAKSGTNWAMQVAVQTAWHGAAEFEHIHELVPWPEAPEPRLAQLSDPRTWEAAPTKLRVIKTHLPLDHLPWHESARYLCIIRDPKEVMVSAHHFLLGTLGIRRRISPARWLDINLAEGMMLTAWAINTASSWAKRELANVHVRTFDQLKADLPGEADAIARFMGVELDPEQRAAVLEKSSLRYMKANEPRFRPLPMALPKPDEWPDMVRRGAAGGAGEMYDAEQRGRIDAFVRAELARLGSDFPYDELFGGR